MSNYKFQTRVIGAFLFLFLPRLVLAVPLFVAFFLPVLFSSSFIAISQHLTCHDCGKGITPVRLHLVNYFTNQKTANRGHEKKRKVQPRRGFDKWQNPGLHRRLWGKRERDAEDPLSCKQEKFSSLYLVCLLRIILTNAMANRHARPKDAGSRQQDRPSAPVLAPSTNPSPSPRQGVGSQENPLPKRK